MVSSRIARWIVLLQQYNLAYVSQKAVKGQALANFLANHPVPSDWEFSDDFPDEDVFYIEVMPPWMIFFNGAELNYSPIEKICLALFFAIDKLEHYMQAYMVRLIAKADPIKYVLSRPVVSGRIA